jgi:gliding motility-associated-like protein
MTKIKNTIMKSILFLIFSVLFNQAYSQQLVQLCDDTQTEFIYSSTADQDGTYWWEIDSNPYQLNQDSIIIDWKNFEIGQHSIEVFFISDSNCYSEPRSIIVNIEECPIPYIWIPNTFTPNSDNDNDVWFPVFKNISSINVKIFNRWGELIFETSDLNSNWNGIYKNQLCQNGIYVYLINWTTLEGRSYPRTGHVLLIR